MQKTTLKTKGLRARAAVASIAVLVAGVLSPYLAAPAHAAALNTSFVRFDRHLTGTIVTWTTCFKPGATAQIDRVKVTFPDTFTVSTTLADYTTSSTNLSWPSGATTLAGLSANATVANNTNGTKAVTFTFTAIASPATTTLYCFNADTNAAAGLTLPASAGNNITGSIVTQDAGPTDRDSGSWGTSVVNGSSNYDQWTTTATVPQRFTYTGPGTNTDNFTGNLDPAAMTSTTGKVVTILTNAPSGYIVWAKDLNTGLNSAARSYTIAAVTPGTNVTNCTGAGIGTEQYTTNVTVAAGSGQSGTPSVATAYAGTCGSGLDTSLRTIGTSTGTSNGDSWTIKENANINNGTPAAGDYTDTITVVAAGLF